MKHTVVALVLFLSLSPAGTGGTVEKEVARTKLVKRCPIGDFECYREDLRSMLAGSGVQAGSGDPGRSHS